MRQDYSAPVHSSLTDSRAAGDAIHRAQRRPLPLAFWIAIALLTPMTALAMWYFFGLDSLGWWTRDDASRRMMLGSAFAVFILHLVALVALIVESRREPA